MLSVIHIPIKCFDPCSCLTSVFAAALQVAHVEFQMFLTWALELLRKAGSKRLSTARAEVRLLFGLFLSCSRPCVLGQTF